MAERVDALVVGSGPAGLMAADAMASAGRRVILTEAKPSIGRKFLMAGKSGLNLTKDEGPDAFPRRYDVPWLAPILAAFGPRDVWDWARRLGIELYVGSSGRVFPVGMKASPLLRAWATRLSGLGVETRTRWRWRGWENGEVAFDTAVGRQLVRPSVVVLALGGGSWARLGSDGAWVGLLREKGVPIAPFRPSNMGFVVEWSAHMAPFLGAAVKNVALTAGPVTERGEFVVSAKGIEGGGVYAVSAPVRDGADLLIDLLPDVPVQAIAEQIAQGRKGDTIGNLLRKRLSLPAVKIALLQEWHRPLPRDPYALAAAIKGLTVHHKGPRPTDEAISTGGGIMREGLTESLELKSLPGVFAAGEMLDWEAPTGGYLLTACLATGLWAGRAAAKTG